MQKVDNETARATHTAACSAWPASSLNWTAARRRWAAGRLRCERQARVHEQASAGAAGDRARTGQR